MVDTIAFGNQHLVYSPNSISPFIGLKHFSDLIHYALVFGLINICLVEFKIVCRSRQFQYV